MTLDNETFSCSSLMDDVAKFADETAKKLENGPMAPFELKKEMAKMMSVLNQVAKLNLEEWKAFGKERE